MALSALESRRTGKFAAALARNDRSLAATSITAQSTIGVAARLACLALSPLAPASAAEVQVRPKATLQFDHGSFDSDRASLSDRWRLRRARVGVDGRLSAGLKFTVEYEMARRGTLRPAGGELKTVALGWRGWQAVDISIGQSKPPFGLTRLESSGHRAFIERALPVEAFAPAHRLGVGIGRSRQHYSFAAMAFGGSINNGSRGHGAAARLTLAPVHTQSDVWHLGVAAMTDTAGGRVRFATPPEADVAGVKLVDSGEITVRRTRHLALEGAVRHGPLLLQGEWLQARLVRPGALADVRFHGWYAEASALLTGEVRPYANGRFGSVTPKHAPGAVELAARYSEISLDDADIRGGREHNMSVGVNYYLNPDMRMLLHYTKAHSRRADTTANPDMLLLRLQLGF